MIENIKTLEDYGIDSTKVSSSSELQKMAIIIRRYNVIEALEHYEKLKFENRGLYINSLRARLISYFTELQAMLERRLSKEDYEKLFYDCFYSTKEDCIIKAIFRLNNELDRILLIRIDNKETNKEELFEV